MIADERIVLAPVIRPVYHPYTDQPDSGIEVLVYAYEEAFGEKVRALGERTRPRDLYDVINLFRNEESRPTASVLLDVISQKCEFKNIPVPELVDLESHRSDLESSWEAMLGHQLPALPPFDNFWLELKSFFDWLHKGVKPSSPEAYVLARGETTIRERSLRLPLSLSGQVHMEVIRFAAANRLCVDLDYVRLDGKRSIRRIEPYSLRRTSSGDIVLHAFNTDKNEHRSYRIERIKGAHITNQIYIPRYKVELPPQGELRVEPSTAKNTRIYNSSMFNLSQRRLSSHKSRRTRSKSGPTYIYECSYCGKKFRRKKMNPRLNTHLDKSGYACSGRYGNYVGIHH